MWPTVIVGHHERSIYDTYAVAKHVVGTNQIMAYLIMMGARLVELYRVLKSTGSLYLHCDPTAGTQ